MRCLTVLAVILLGGLLPVHATGQTLPRGFEIIDVTRDDLHQEKPRINSRGQIVFKSKVVGQTGEIMLYDTDGSLIQLTDDNVFDTLPDIADDGTVVWMKWIGPPNQNGPTPEIMMRTPDGQVTRLTDNDVWDWSPTVNNLRQVAWHQDTGQSCGLTSDIFMFDGSEIVRITDDSLREGVTHQSPEISDRSEIVWTRYDFCDPAPGHNFSSGIMMYSNGLVSRLSGTQWMPQTPDINNLSQVVWDYHDVNTHEDFIASWENGVTTTLVVDGIVPAINDRGDVAFDRWDQVRSHTDIWLYREGELFQITRDPFDNIVPDINNRGELCWGFGTSHARLDIRYMRRLDAGDVNCDGTIDAFDIEPFIFALFDPAGYLRRYPDCDPLLADIDHSGNVDALDIEPFLTILFG